MLPSGPRRRTPRRSARQPARPGAADARRDDVVTGRGAVARAEDDRLLDVEEAGALLGLSPATLYGWAYRRRVPVVKLSGPRGPLRFWRSDLLRLAEQHTRPALRASA